MLFECSGDFAGASWAITKEPTGVSGEFFNYICLDESRRFVHFLGSIILYLPSLGKSTASISRTQPPARILKFCHRLWHHWPGRGCEFQSCFSVWRTVLGWSGPIFLQTPRITQGIPWLVFDMACYRISMEQWSLAHKGGWPHSLIPMTVLSPYGTPMQPMLIITILITILIITRVSLTITILRNQRGNPNDSYHFHLIVKTYL